MRTLLATAGRKNSVLTGRNLKQKLVGERKMRQKTHFGREPENNNNYFFLKLEPYAK